MSKLQTEIKIADLPCYSVEDYMSWEGRWELIRGVPFAMSPSPIIRHQEISVKIAAQLDSQLENCTSCHVIASVDWHLSEDTVVQPDITVFCGKIETHWLEPKDIPTLIIEILSPSTKKKDLGIKYRLYQEVGVKYYCIVDPKTNSVSVFLMEKDQYKKGEEFQDGCLRFELGQCQVELDFGKIFQQLNR